MIAYKVCGNGRGGGCGSALPLDDFHRCRRMPDGHHDLCKACRCEIERQRYAEKAEAILLPQKARYYRANRDRILERDRKRWAANADEINSRRRARKAKRRGAKQAASAALDSLARVV